MRARGGDLMPETIPAVGLLIVRSDPVVGTFDFDRQKPGINSEAVTKSVPRGLACVAGACLLPARTFFLVPTTSKRLLRRLLEAF